MNTPKNSFGRSSNDALSLPALKGEVSRVKTMRISPLATRTIQDIYNTGCTIFENIKKNSLCFIKTKSEFEDVNASIGDKQRALTTAFVKLNSFAVSDDFPKINEVFTLEEKMAWSISTRAYIQSMTAFKEMYGETSCVFSQNILEGLSEAIFIENKINENINKTPMDSTKIDTTK